MQSLVSPKELASCLQIEDPTLPRCVYASLANGLALWVC